MTCAICGASTRKGTPPILVPRSLAGEAACDWCGQRLRRLQEGSLQRPELEALLTYVRRQGNQSLEAELESLWVDPGAIVAAATAEAEAQAAARARAITEILTTSGFEFEGHRIVSYLDFLSSEVVLGMGVFRGIGADFADFFGAEAQGLSRRLQDAKAAAFSRLRESVHDRGGNAIIGIDLDYTMFGASLVGVVASGTAVVIAELS